MDLSSFKIIVEKVSSKSLAKSAESFSAFFRLPVDAAENILKSAPVVFLNNLSKNEFKLLKDGLIELSKTGIEFKATTSNVNLPEIRWASKPVISTSGFDAEPSKIDVKSFGFTCPSCGEMFVLKNIPQIKQQVRNSAETLGTPEQAQGKAEVTKPSTEEETTAPVAEAGRNETEIAEEQTEEIVAAPDEIIEPLEEDEPKASEESVEDINIEDMDMSQEEQNEGSDDDFELEPVEENTVTNGDKQEEPAEQSSKAETHEPAGKELEQSIKTEEQSPQQSNGEKYKVFVSSLKDAKKKKELIKIICDYRGISESEANRLTKRLIIPVAKDISKDKADELVTQLKKLSITAKKTKS